MSIEILKAGAEDIEAVYEIERGIFSNPADIKQLEAMLNNPIYSIYTATAGGRITGYVIFYTVVDEAFIVSIAVSEEERGQGTGGLLLDKCIYICKENDCATLSLEVRKSNAPAIRLYESRGFINCGGIKNYYEKPVEDAIIYTKYFEDNHENSVF